MAGLKIQSHPDPVNYFGCILALSARNPAVHRTSFAQRAFLLCSNALQYLVRLILQSYRLGMVFDEIGRTGGRRMVPHIG